MYKIIMKIEEKAATITEVEDKRTAQFGVDLLRTAISGINTTKLDGWGNVVQRTPLSKSVSIYMEE